MKGITGPYETMSFRCKKHRNDVVSTKTKTKTKRKGVNQLVR